MRLYICAFAAFFVALTAVDNASADASAGQGYFTAMGSYIDDDNDRNVDDGIQGGQFGFGYALNQSWNLEGLVMASQGNGSPDQSHRGLGIDLQRVFRRDERFSPYLHIGAGFFEVDPAGLSAQNGAMYSGGAGFLLDLFDSNISLRGEWRYRSDDALPNNLADNLFSVGLQLPFGAGKPKWVDTDGDGVADGLDRCPNTRTGVSVDAYGCEVDSDGDGVKDSMDECPNTPAGVAVNAKGCAQDSDGDGVSDDKDRCPNTPAGAAVDENGCELDGDGDGVVDRLDQCPNSAKGVQVDIKGCEIKEEILLRGVNFETNSDKLLPGAESVLNDAVATLQKNPTIKVEVAGHTDSDGAAEYNAGLSARRAQTVHDYLATGGVSVDRMSVRGYGEEQPIADNSSAAGKAENRRVALRITER